MPAPASSSRTELRCCENIDAMSRATGAGVMNCPNALRDSGSSVWLTSRRLESTLSVTAMDDSDDPAPGAAASVMPRIIRTEPARQILDTVNYLAR